MIIGCLGGFLKVTEALVSKGINVISTNKNKTTPLSIAVLCANENIVEFLIKHGANVNATDQVYTCPCKKKKKEKKEFMCV